MATKTSRRQRGRRRRQRNSQDVGSDVPGSALEPVIFLDIDGVLTSFAAHEQLARACVARLNRLFQASGAIVVLTSSWRERFPLARIQSLL